jgi:hypothetical protein
LFIDIPCVLVAGWATLRIYQAASRRRLLEPFLYPFFLVLCVVTYSLHVVQNFRFVYDLPSLMFFSVGLYLIYFRKSTVLLVVLFAVATLNRETTLLLIPFFLLSACVDRTPPAAGEPGPTPIDSHPGGAKLTIHWRGAVRAETAVPALLMLAYWAAWHLFVFHVFRHNVSEYYPRLHWNWNYFTHVRYYPQLAGACGYLLPVLLLFRKRIPDPQLRLWVWVLPAWYAVMGVWGLLVETRIFGELLPYVACSAAILAEEALTSAVQRNSIITEPEEEPALSVSRAA